MLAVEAQDHEIRTIEGMAQGEQTASLAAEIPRSGALQCGICTSGMLVASDALLKKNPEPERGGSPLLARRQPLPVHRL
jgi:carbon-monoxide dehydrogenase small subunit